MSDSSEDEFSMFQDTFTMDDGREVDIRFVDGTDMNLMLMIKPNGKMGLHLHVPPYVAVALLAGAAQAVASRHGLHVPDCIKRFKIEAQHGPLGHFSDN